MNHTTKRLLCSFLCCLSIVWAQNLSFKQAVLCGDGSHLLLWGKNDAQWQGIPQDMADKIMALNKQGEAIRQVAVGDNGTWVILSGQNNIHWSAGILQELADKLTALYRQGEVVHTVVLHSFGDYLILWGKNQSQWRGIPQEMADKLTLLYQNGDVISGATLCLDNTWVIWGPSNASWSGIPQEMANKITALYKKNQPIAGAAMRSDGVWVVFWGKYDATWAGIPKEMADKIVKLHAAAESAAAAPPTFKGKTYAVIVGVAKYNHVNSLSYSDDDAYKIYSFLKSPEGGALPDAQIAILIDEDATKQNILKYISIIFSKATTNDMILFYFSGHGLEGSFIPYDYDGTSNTLDHTEISAIIKQSQAKHKIVIADACYSGSLDRQARNYQLPQTIESYYTALDNSLGGSGTALFMSSKADETSIEFGGLRQGVFSYYLIEGLKGKADSNQNKIVTLTEIFNYVSINTKAYTQNQQSPKLNGQNYDPEMPIGVIAR